MNEKLKDAVAMGEAADTLSAMRAIIASKDGEIATLTEEVTNLAGKLAAALAAPASAQAVLVAGSTDRNGVLEEVAIFFEQPLFDQQKIAFVVSEIRALKSAPGAAPQPVAAAQAVPEFDDYPEFHQMAMGCGLEDRGITDRYDAMRYGWDEAIERVAERISNFLASPSPAAPSQEAEPAVQATKSYALNPLEHMPTMGIRLAYYVRHPDNSYSLADPQPTLLKPEYRAAPSQQPAASPTEAK